MLVLDMTLNCLFARGVKSFSAANLAVHFALGTPAKNAIYAKNINIDKKFKLELWRRSILGKFVILM